jgi:hypothetical protein
MGCPSSWEICRGANHVSLEQLQLLAKPTGLKWMRSLYPFEGVQPSIPTGEHLTRCGSATTSTPLDWDHGRQRHQAAPFSRSRQHQSCVVSKLLFAESETGRRLQLSIGPSLEVQLVDWVRSDQTLRSIQPNAACATCKRGGRSEKSKRAPVRAPPHQFNVQDPIETLSATDKPMSLFVSDRPASSILAPRRCENP